MGVFIANPSEGASLEPVREIDKEEYGSYVGDVKVTLACRSDYRQFTMIRHAYVEYVRELRYYEEMLARPVRLDEILEDDLVHNLNRRLRGFFSELRVFLDNTQTKLKRRYGKDSGKWRVFRAACAHQFDNSFAYRFVYGLRNYAVHVNLPLNAVSLTSSQEAFDPEDLSTRNQLRVEIDRDMLLREFDWRSDVRSGLEEFPPRFELGPYVDEAMACLEKIHIELFCAKLPDEQRAAERLLALAGSAGGPGTPCVFRVGGQEPIVNGVVLQTDAFSNGTDDEPDWTGVHIGWIPVEVAGMVVGLPEAQEIRTHEHIDWEIRDATPRSDGEVLG